MKFSASNFNSFVSPNAQVFCTWGQYEFETLVRLRLEFPQDATPHSVRTMLLEAAAELSTLPADGKFVKRQDNIFP